MPTWQDAAADDDHIDWVRRMAPALAGRSSSGGGYINYGTPDEPADRVRSAYGDANFARLQRIKRHYDPHNIFRFNQNIPPAKG